MKKLRPIMLVGTGSDVGKSVINAAFCRIFQQDGYAPAPFKAQNMSLNSYATADDLEIGRAQAMQAEACKIECSTHMNPVLLKPSGDMKSQVIINGKVIGNQSQKEYFFSTDRDKLFELVMRSFDFLEKNFNPIVAEGAGSITEMNLWDKDITNMKVAQRKNCSTYLIADIDKGGVFASVYGSIKLLPKEQRDLIDGIIINKFRGDVSLFSQGKKIIEEITGKPIVGIIPYFNDIFIEPEDSVAIDNKPKTAKEKKINICVVHTPHISNFTDFENLERLEGVNLYYSYQIEEINKADIIILPGSKNTISDLQFIKNLKIDKLILEHIAQDKQVYGICGGYQMMGEYISDPHQVEGQVSKIKGLGILPVQTILSKEKKTVRKKFKFMNFEDSCYGYEIHMGDTKTNKEKALCFSENSFDGYLLNQKIWGSYIHGIFDNAVIIKQILKQVKPEFNLDFNYKEFKNKEFDKLASLIRSTVDMEYIYSKMKS